MAKRQKYVKTYGVRGLLEWDMALRAGEAVVRLHFGGGSMGTNGVVCAKYSTDNAALQRLIEGSVHFRTGRVYLHGSPVKGGVEEYPDPARKVESGSIDKTDDSYGIGESGEDSGRCGPDAWRETDEYV